MRTTIKIKQRQATMASCTSGQPFIRRMFKEFSVGGVMNLTKKRLDKMSALFEAFHSKSKSQDIAFTSLQIHHRCFFNELLSEVERKEVKRYTSAHWERYQYGVKVSTIINAFWKELSRVAK